MSDNTFTSTWWNGSTRRMLLNNERILSLERIEKDGTVVFVVHFDTGYEIELDEPTGKMFELQLQRVDRAQPPVQYVERRYYPPRLPRRTR